MADIEKQVMVVGVEESEQSTYALEWTLDHFFAPFASIKPFKLVVVHAKPTATSAVGLAGPGTYALRSPNTNQNITRLLDGIDI